VNVCCAIVASHCQRPSRGRIVQSAITVAPGLNFDPFRRPEADFRAALSPEFVLQTFKTQNDVRSADAHPPVRSISSRTAKARNCPISQRLRGGKRRRSQRSPRFRAALPIWDSYRGKSRGKPPNPHTFPCSRRSGTAPCTPFAEARISRPSESLLDRPGFRPGPIPGPTLLAMARLDPPAGPKPLRRGEGPAIHAFDGAIPGSRFACPGMELKQAALTSIPPSRQPFRAGL
jgi:hypothetical protein